MKTLYMHFPAATRFFVDARGEIEPLRTPMFVKKDEVRKQNKRPRANTRGRIVRQALTALS